MGEGQSDMRSQDTETAGIESVRCCVLFDGEDGEIRYLHPAGTRAGTAGMPEAEAESRALTLAGNLGWDAARLRAVHVALDRLKPGSRYKVDPQSGTLLAREPTRSWA